MRHTGLMRRVVDVSLSNPILTGCDKFQMVLDGDFRKQHLPWTCPYQPRRIGKPQTRFATGKWNGPRIPLASIICSISNQGTVRRKRWGHFLIVVSGKLRDFSVRKPLDINLAVGEIIAGAAPGDDVAHRLHGPGKLLDNRRSNLRRVSRSQNNANARKKAGASSSIFKGVSLSRSRLRPWRASIWSGGRRRDIGFFREEGHAAMAYDLAAVRLYGDSALTNFPIPGSENALFGGSK